MFSEREMGGGRKTKHGAKGYGTSTGSKMWGVLGAVTGGDGEGGIRDWSGGCMELEGTKRIGEPLPMGRYLRPSLTCLKSASPWKLMRGLHSTLPF